MKLAHPLLTALSAVLAGASATLAFAPFSLWPFALLSPAMLWLLLRGQTPSTALWRGWGYGVGFFGAGVSWVYISIHDYGSASPLLAGTLTLAFCAALGLLFALQACSAARLLRNRPGAWLGFALIWWLFEWLRGWLLTGFPWLYLGYAWLDTPLQHWAPVTGVWGLSLLTVVLAAGCAEALAQRRMRPVLPGALAVVISFVLPGQWTQPSGTPLTVALLQPNTPQLAKWSSEHLNRILKQQIAQTLPYADRDLIIWPETAIPAFYSQVAPQLSPLLEHLDSTGATLISGLPTRTADSHDAGHTIYHNSLAILSGGSGVYHKRRLVPFGEYVPLEQYLRGLIAFFDLPMSAFSLPQRAQPLLQAKGQPLAAAICYEIAYPELVRATAREASMILTVSNDTWFGRSIGPDQHLQIARMRALENGRWVLRGTNNGLTALIDAQGRVQARLPVDQPLVLAGEALPMQGQTPYQRLGVGPTLGLSLLLLAILLRRPLITTAAGKHHRATATGLDH